MESLPNRSDVPILSGIGSNSGQTILQLTKIKSWETPKHGVTVVKSTSNHSIRSHKSSMMWQIVPEMLTIPDLSKTRCADILDMPQKGTIAIKPYTKIPDSSYRREEIAKNIYCKRYVAFVTLFFDPKIMNSVLSRLSFNLLADNHFLMSSKQLFNLSKV